MANETELELYRQHSDAMDKYRYFLLAAAGASIAFALTQTQRTKLSFQLIPLGLAVLCWGLSFYLGCVHIDNLLKSLTVNLAIETARAGKDPLVTDVVGLQIAVEVGNRRFKEFGEVMASSHRWQFRFLILGAVLYITWHVIGMA